MQIEGTIQWRLSRFLLLWKCVIEIESQFWEEIMKVGKLLKCKAPFFPSLKPFTADIEVLSNILYLSKYLLLQYLSIVRNH